MDYSDLTAEERRRRVERVADAYLDIEKDTVAIVKPGTVFVAGYATIAFFCAGVFLLVTAEPHPLAYILPVMMFLASAFSAFVGKVSHRHVKRLEAALNSED